MQLAPHYGNKSWSGLDWSRLNHGCVSHESESFHLHPANETKDSGNELAPTAIYSHLLAISVLKVFLWDCRHSFKFFICEDNCVKRANCGRQSLWGALNRRAVPNWIGNLLENIFPQIKMLQRQIPKSGQATGPLQESSQLLRLLARVLQLLGQARLWKSCIIFVFAFDVLERC